MSKEIKKPIDFWLNESLNEFGDRNGFNYQVYKFEAEALSARYQAYPKCISTIHVRKVMPIDWVKIFSELNYNFNCELSGEASLYLAELVKLVEKQLRGEEECITVIF